MATTENMDYENNLKLASKKVDDNYLVVVIDYSNKFVFPYKDGIAFMSIFKNAETLSNDGYNTDPYIEPMKLKIETEVINRAEYLKMKVLFLLQGKSTNE